MYSDSKTSVGFPDLHLSEVCDQVALQHDIWSTGALALRHVIHSGRLHGNICFSALAEEGLSDALMLPLAGRMQTAEGEIPLQLIREQLTRAYTCDGVQMNWAPVGAGPPGESGGISALDLKELHVHLSTVISESTGLLISKCGAGRQSSFHQLNSELLGCITMDVFLSFCWDIPLFFLDCKGKKKNHFFITKNSLFK